MACLHSLVQRNDGKLQASLFRCLQTAANKAMQTNKKIA